MVVVVLVILSRLVVVIVLVIRLVLELLRLALTEKTALLGGGGRSGRPGLPLFGDNRVLLFPLQPLLFVLLLLLETLAGLAMERELIVLLSFTVLQGVGLRASDRVARVLLVVDSRSGGCFVVGMVCVVGCAVVIMGVGMVMGMIVG